MEETIPELIGISITKKLMGEMEEISSADVSIETGIFGDIRGKKRNRQISVLFEDDWLDACNDVNENLHWMNRRANLFVRGVRSPQKEGSIIKIGNVKLEVRQETTPCEMMEKLKTGLFEALEKNWRGGVCCNVIEPGHISIGDDVQIT